MGRNESFGYRIACLHRYAQRYYNREFEHLGLGNGTYSFLMALHHEKGINQNRLSEILHTDKANTARAIKKLVNLGYVEKKRDATDQRAFELHVTRKALKILPEIKGILQSWTSIMTKGMDKQNRYYTSEQLNKMIENATKYLIKIEKKEIEQ